MYTWKMLNTYVFRYDPVPLTGRGSYGWGFRSPRTFQEKRKFYDCPAELVRGARHPCNLPDNWDDVSRGKIRNWKKQSHCPKQHGRDQNKIRQFKRQFCY